MNTDDKLKEIPFYQYHPEYLPFIGEKFDEYRILHIGESHFLNQTEANATISYKDFKGWWTGQENPKIAEQSKESHYTTRSIVQWYMGGDRTKAHGIFTNVARSFSEQVLGSGAINAERASANYEYFAFMNFYQQPALYKGLSYWKALHKSTAEGKDHCIASKHWDECVLESIKVIDAVIECLEPELVVFTSASASNAYCSEFGNGKFAKESYVIYTYHPGSPYWNRAGHLTKGKTGKEVFEEALKMLKSSV